MANIIRRLAVVLTATLRDGCGVTSIEYAAIASLISVGIIVGFNVFTSGVSDMFAYVVSHLAF